MICPFCSLLCDEDELDSIQCSRRTTILTQIATRQKWPLRDIEGKFDIAKAALQRAKHVLVTGRITSVETARAAVAFSAKYNATLDCAESGRLFHNVLAIQRAGLNSVSIAEARDHTDMFVIIGNDDLLPSVPRMPCSLRNPLKTQTVLLLGDFDADSMKPWRGSGFDTWSIPCDLKDVPKALFHWSRWSDAIVQEGKSGSNTVKKSLSGKLFHAMATAPYTTVLWSVECLALAQADLWVERILEWIASRNETSRCAGLPWASTDGTFMQVCTWLTGFPGRIAFRHGVPDYDPIRHSYERWILRNENSPVPDSVLVLIDETMNSKPFLPHTSSGNQQNAFVIELTPYSEAFPTAIAGYDQAADMFRADQTLLAHVDPKGGMQSSWRTAASWLERLSV